MRPPRIRTNDQFKAVQSVLDEEGISFTVSSSRKHYSADFTVAGKRLRFMLSSSPSDKRSSRNAKADVRRMIRTARENARG